MYRHSAAFLFIVALFLAATCSPALPVAHARTPHANGWTITTVLTAGQNGFERLRQDAFVAENGLVVLSATRNGQDGIYAIRATQVITVATVGMPLPGTAGTIAGFSQYNVDANGAVFFGAIGTNELGEHGFSVYRWANGTISRVATATSIHYTHVLTFLTSNGKWVSIENIPEAPPNRVVVFHVADSLGSTPVFTATERLGFGACPRITYTPRALNASGVMLYGRLEIQNHTSGGCSQTGPTTYTTMLALAGGVSKTVTTAQRIEQDGITSGDFVRGLKLNNVNSVLYFRDSEPTTEQLILKDTSGERVLRQTTTAAAGSVHHVFGLDNAGRVAFQTSEGIYAGPDLDRDLVIKQDDTRLGGTIHDLTLLDVTAPASTSSDDRSILFHYTLRTDSTIGPETLAIATKGSTQWTNASGGSWATAGNWSPAEVPGQSTSVGFGLDASYDVMVGTRQAGRVEVTNGSVGFRDAQLTLTGPLEVGGDADLVVPDGGVSAGEITLGHLPPANPAQPPLARLAASNSGTTLTTGGPLRVGVASNGQLDLNSGAVATSAETRLGDGSSGTANVRDAGTRWTTGNIVVGNSVTGTLTIEDGARVDSGAAFVGGTPEQPEPTITSTSRVRLRGRDSVWNVAQLIAVGRGQAGNVQVQTGATLNAGGLVLGLGKEAVESAVIVRGSDGARRATLAVAGNIRVGFFGSPGNEGFLSIQDGALATVGDELSVGVASEGTVHVGGRNALGNPATLDVLEQKGACTIGNGANASLLIDNGGIVRCIDIAVDASEGESSIFVATSIADECNGPVGSTPRDPAVLKGVTMTIGARGEVQLQHGLVQVILTRVLTQGLLHGCGSVEGAVTVEPGGTLAPGIRRQASRILRLATAPSVVADTLTISGTLAISPTGVLELDVLGRSPGQYDRVVVTGAAQLDGVLRLSFSDGFAPKQGDVFTFVQAGSATGEFEKVELSGLADGFQFELGADGSLTALNDGVPTTQATRRQVYLPLLQR